VSNLRNIVWNGTIWLAGGSHIIYSSDGFNWTISTSANYFISGGAVVCITWGAGKFVVVGYTSGNAAQFIITSSDGITWTQLGNGSSLIAGKVNVSYSLKSLAYGNGLFVFASKVVIYSVDGITWYQSGTGTSALGTGSVYAVCWNGSFFLAGGQAMGGGANTGVLIRSTDAAIWTSPSVNITGGWVNDITWNQQKFVIATYQGPSPYMYSTDGLTWGSGTGSNFPNGISSVTWNGTYFIGVGNVSASAWRVHYSTDGITWSRSTSGDSIVANPSGVASKNVLPFTPANLVYVGPIGPIGPTGSTANGITRYLYGSGTTSSGTLAVTFSTAFASAPNVTATISGSTAAFINVSTITTTMFTVNTYNISGTLTNYTFNWHAVL
jgi:hypothetical protein